jgi:hypothetical protein
VILRVLKSVEFGFLCFVTSVLKRSELLTPKHSAYAECSGVEKHTVLDHNILNIVF